MAEIPDNSEFKIKLQPLSFSKQIDQYFESLKNLKNSNSKKKILRNNLYTALCLIQIYERKAIPDDKDNFQKKLITTENFLKSNGLDILASDNNFQKVYKKLLKNFNKEFNPVCSIIGGIVSQEVFKVLTGSEKPFMSLYTFDSEQESGNFLNLLKL